VQNPGDCDPFNTEVGALETYTGYEDCDARCVAMDEELPHRLNAMPLSLFQFRQNQALPSRPATSRTNPAKIAELQTAVTAPRTGPEPRFCSTDQGIDAIKLKEKHA